MSDDRIAVDDLTDEQIERVLNSKGFQKMLAYSKLADGIQVLEAEDEIFESMVGTITARHDNIRSEKSTRDVLRLFREEVSTFTDPLVDEEESMEANDLEELYVGGEEA